MLKLLVQPSPELFHIFAEISHGLGSEQACSNVISNDGGIAMTMHTTMSWIEDDDDDEHEDDDRMIMTT